MGNQNSTEIHEEELIGERSLYLEACGCLTLNLRVLPAQPPVTGRWGQAGLPLVAGELASWRDPQGSSSWHGTGCAICKELASKREEGHWVALLLPLYVD